MHISYLPLAHVFETVVMNYCLFAGCAVGFYQGDTLKLLDDLQTLRPTVFVSVPRLYTRFYDKIVGGAKAKGGIATALFNRTAAKLEVLHATGSEHHAFWDAIVFKKVQKSLGLDRCTKMICGSAPITAKVKDFARRSRRALRRGLWPLRDLRRRVYLPPGGRVQPSCWHAVYVLRDQVGGCARDGIRVVEAVAFGRGVCPRPVRVWWLL